ncbi:MAG: aminopeptidase P family protein [Candidatus Bathyarchaeota archaeon]|nr:aminopeptidase P family protein [Candidatus Bathyarchaeota archaeon]
MNRTKALKQAATKQDKPATFAIFNQNNITYFTNFSGANALLIPEHGENVLYVSPVNYEQAKAETRGVEIQLLRRGENLMEKIAKQTSATKICVDNLGIESWRLLAKAVGGEEKLEVANSLICELRKKKNLDEIHLIREACKLSNLGMQTAAKTICVGVKEKEIAAEAEYAMRKAGSDGVAFDTIVASGLCCAYPHGTFMERTIQQGDLVMVDLGATFRFYRSDITRTFSVGEPSEEQAKMMQTVKLAQQVALGTMKPGVLAKDVDAAARRVIADAGFGEFFVHNLGHGVGLEVHEAPILSPDSKDVLEEGNVVTVEPGIYLPGFCGVRIEDTVLVTSDGAEKLTHA